MLVKLKDNKEDKIQKKEVITLENKLDDFFEKIRKLRNSNINEADYEKILSELLWSKKENSLIDIDINNPCIFPLDLQKFINEIKIFYRIFCY